MITPEYLSEVMKKTEDSLSKLNNYLVNRIADRIVAGFKKSQDSLLIPSTLHDMHKMLDTGMVYEDVEKGIKEALPEIQKEVKQAFLDSANEIAEYNNNFAKDIVDTHLFDVDVPKFEQVGIPKSAEDLNLSPSEIRMLESAYRRTNGEIKNLCKTCPSSAQNSYIEACDNAFWKVKHGVSLNTAIVEAVDEVAKKGITTVYYESGREDKIEVAIARAVRTGINQANADITLMRCAEMGVDYVKVSEHLGARVTGTEDYKDHSWWQGKVYKLNWNSTVLSKYEYQASENEEKFSFLDRIKKFLHIQKKYDYPDFIETCGYGNILGICGINCRHTFNNFYPNLNIDRGQQIDPQENLKRYEAEKKQRSMERDIRETKRRIEAIKHSDLDTEETKIELQKLNKKLRLQDERLREHNKKFNLRSQNYRKHIPKTFKNLDKKIDIIDIKNIKLENKITQNIISNDDIIVVKRQISYLSKYYNIELDGLEILNEEEHLQSPMFYSPFEEDGVYKAKIVLNNACDFWTNEKTRKYVFSGKLFAGRSLEDFVNHELAHVMTFQKCKTLKECEDMQNELKKIDVLNVSNYDKRKNDFAESIAEAFVCYSRGDNIPNKWYDVLEKYIGDCVK